MTLLADKSADAGSNTVRGAAAQTKTFVMPGNQVLSVESVAATISNGAGSAVTPTLIIKEADGTVIAEVPASDSIPAGGSGVATWALRLADKGGDGATITTGLERILDGTGVTFTAGNSGYTPWVRFGGDVLLDYTDPLHPTLISDGIYAFSMQALVSPSPGPLANGSVMYGVLVYNDFDAPVGIGNQIPFSNTLGTLGGPTVSATRFVAAGTPMSFNVQNLAAGTAKFQLIGYVARLS